MPSRCEWNQFNSFQVKVNIGSTSKITITQFNSKTYQNTFPTTKTQYPETWKEI